MVMVVVLIRAAGKIRRHKSPTPHPVPDDLNLFLRQGRHISGHTTAGAGRL